MFKIKIEFDTNYFDDLDVTQEQLDAIVEQIQALAASGKITESGAYDLEGNPVSTDLKRSTTRGQRLH
jgi:hypothetical protein